MSVRNQVEQLVEMVKQGRIIDAVNQFYAEDVVMQENGLPPTVGKAINLKREQEFVESVAEMHVCDARSILADENRAAIHWVMEYTGKDGNRYRLDQVATQEWKEGKIVRERFFYDTAAVVVEAA